MNGNHSTARWALWAMLALGTATAMAAETPGGAASGPGMRRDPWVPAEVRARAAAEPRQAPTQGAALAAQVERKLRAQFAAADRQGRGRITREQARASGLGAIAEHFDEIDAQGRGSVSFDDYKRFLKQRGANTL
jgi:hypothetical protein